MTTNISRDPALEAALRQRGRESLEKTLQVLRSGAWRLSHRTRSGDELRTCSVKGVGRVHMITSFFNSPASTIQKIVAEEIEKYPTWCSAYVKDSCVRLMVLGDDMDVTYAVTGSRMGGLVSPRDWLGVRHWRQCLDESGVPEMVFSNVSVDHPDVPHGKNGWVRGDALLSCYAFADVPPEEGATGPRSRLRFLCAARLGGWLPNSIVERYFAEGMLEFVASLRVTAEGDS